MATVTSQRLRSAWQPRHQTLSSNLIFHTIICFQPPHNLLFLKGTPQQHPATPFKMKLSLALSLISAASAASTHRHLAGWTTTEATDAGDWSDWKGGKSGKSGKWSGGGGWKPSCGPEDIEGVYQCKLAFYFESLSFCLGEIHFVSC
jgi:hypothetical protein